MSGNRRANAPNPGCEHHRGRQRRHQQTHPSCRLFAQPNDLIEDRSDLGECGTQTTDELFALLIGPDGGFITGSDFLMDGGVTAVYWFGERAAK